LNIVESLESYNRFVSLALIHFQYLNVIINANTSTGVDARIGNFIRFAFVITNCHVKFNEPISGALPVECVKILIFSFSGRYFGIGSIWFSFGFASQRIPFYFVLSGWLNAIL